LSSRNSINRVVFDTHEPELERYGGPELICLVEYIFNKDSILAFDLINLSIKQNFFDKNTIGIFTAYSLLCSFDLTMQEQLKLVNNMILKKEYTDDFRKNKEKYINITNKENTWENFRTKVNNNIIKHLENRRESIYLFEKNFKKLLDNGSVYNSLNNIISSLIHMSLNRIGCNSFQEQEILQNIRIIIARNINIKK
jgi:thiopeptide-type bacteriocin biosynthesis protein